MKIRTMLLTAGLAIASLGVSAGASAQTYNGGDRRDSGYDRDQRSDQRDRRDDRRDDRRYDRRDDRRDWRNDRGNHYGWNRHQRCWTEWHRHHRVRVCR